MAAVVVSLWVLAAAVLLSEALRRASGRLSRGSAAGLYLLEAASTFQLCSCTHELKLLGEASLLEPPLGVALCYAVTLLHLLSFRGASCNPAGALEGLWRGSRGPAAACAIIACQFGAAVAAQWFAASVWSLGLSDVHVRHQRFGFRCFDPLGGTLLEAAAAELACAFAVQAAVMHVHRLDEKLRAPLIAAVITGAVSAAGSISGAIFNPVLAFSVQFPCSGHTYAEYCFVYWLPPLAGMASCIFLFERIIPFLSGKSAVGFDSSAAVHKQKTQ